MLAWQQRVIDEKTELDNRITRLENAINGEMFKTYDLIQQDLMMRQRNYMRAYSDTLRQRIEEFK